MPGVLSAREILDNEFLAMRAKVLELAAALDRLDVAEGDVQSDERVIRLQEALSILSQERDDRAAEVQLLFSRPYEEDWRETFGL